MKKAQIKYWKLPSGRHLEWDGSVLTFLSALGNPMMALPKADTRALFVRLKSLYRD